MKKMAFSFFGLKKQKNTEPTYHYAIKEMQEFFLEKLEAEPDGGNHFLKQLLKKINQHSIGHLLMIFSANLRTYNYYAYLHNDKYTDMLELSFEKFYLTYGKDKTDELLQDIKACFDANEFALICAEGKWRFPEGELYEACAKAGITSLDNDFAKQKAMTVAKNILNESNIPAQYHTLYVNQDLIADLFQNGKAKFNAEEAVKEAERRKPRQGKLSEAEYQYIKLSQSLCPLFGIDKRIYMIEDVIQKINKNIADYEEGQKAIRELGFLLSTSVSQEKKKDWAFLGGLADGIAGPGAGISVAANAIAENMEIEKRNAQARQAANQTIRSLYADASNLSADISDLENERKLMQYHLQAAKNKVVMEQHATDEIFEKLKITAKVTKRKDCEGLEVIVTLKNDFKVNVPENVQVAVDGTLSAKVFFEDTLLDTICVPLPLFGVSEKESITVYTDYYVEAEGNYSVDILPNRLWIVEV